MTTWILYDIVEDKARAQVAKYCKQAGLYRVQYSVFVGVLDANAKDELTLKMTAAMDEDTDKVYVFPMTRDMMRQTVLLGQAFDKKLVSDQVKALFL